MNETDSNRQQLHLYEWAVVRFVPKVEREEFFNIGVILLCKRQRKVMVEFKIDNRKFECFGGDISKEQLESQLKAYEEIAAGGKSAGAMGEWAAEDRFRWLTAMKSACIQTSRPHPGKTTDLESTFGKLKEEYL